MKISVLKMICSADLSAGDHFRQCSSDILMKFAPKLYESSLREESYTHQLEVCEDTKSSIHRSNECFFQNCKSNSHSTPLHSSFVTERLSTENNDNVCSCPDSYTTFQNALQQCGLKNSSLQNSKSSEISTTYNDLTPIENLSLEISVNSLCCSACVEAEDVTKRQLNELEERLKILVSDLMKEKSNNHLLKRRFLVAKKVLRNETGELSTEDIDRLMMKSSESGWKGQQEIILALKRKVRTLGTEIKRLEAESDEQDRRRSLLQMQSGKPVPSMSNFDEGSDSWYIDLEREETLKNEERYEKILVSSRDSMKDALECQKKRNEELTNEIYVVTEELTWCSKNTTATLPDRLRQLEKRMRCCLEEKFEERRELDSLQEQICHKSRALLDLKEKIHIEKKTAAAKKAMLTSLHKSNTSFCMLSLELSEVKCKQASITRKLDEMLKQYGKIAIRGEVIFTPAVDGRILLRKLNLIHKQNTTNKDDGKKYRTPKTITEEKSTMPTVPFKRVTFVQTANVYKIKLAKYQEKFKHFESQNLAKLKELQDTICKTKEELSIVLRNRDTLLKLETDINVLKNRRKKICKAVSQLPKRKLVRKKNSSTQLTEILDAGRMHFNILKLESKFLRTLIKRIFASRGDDQDLLESFFKRNKNLLLKGSYSKS